MIICIYNVAGRTRRNEFLTGTAYPASNVKNFLSIAQISAECFLQCVRLLCNGPF